MKTKVSIVKCENYNEKEVEAAVRKAIKDIGFTFKEKTKVLIKPNILSQHKPEEYITTHPAVIDAICKVLNENNCEIMIGDSSGWYKDGGTRRALNISGMEEVAKKNKAKLIPFEETEVKIIKDDNAKILRELNIAGIVLDADLVINVPKLKTHELVRFTGGVKNLLGCMPGGLKQKCHIIAKNEEEFGNLLLDIYQNIKPGLNILDGIIGIEGEGPGTGGKPKKTGLILASENAVALDIVAERIIDMKPEDIVTTRDAVKRGLFPGYDNIEIIGELVKIPYEKPRRFGNVLPKFINDFIFRQGMVYPFIEQEKCKKCMVCVNVCPAKTIKVTKDKVVYVDKSGCINCYCCHEMCPHKAIELKSSKIIEILKKVRDLLAKIKKRK